MDWRVVIFDTNLNGAEIKAVKQVLSSGWISMGTAVRALEQEFAAAIGVTDAVAVSSGTAALHIAALTLGLGPGDEVIVPSLSFVASAATIALTGARPVFAEIKSPHDLTIDPEDVAQRITPRTKAVVAMHYGGYAADMDALLALARRHDLAIIEDAAHAPLVRTENGMLGTLGDIGCFSFFATKNMTTGEGGGLIARDPAHLRKARALRSHCMTTTSWDKHKGRTSAYDVDDLGFNYRMTDIAAAIGQVQLAKLPASRQRRLALVQAYRSLLDDLPEIRLPFENREHDSAHHLFPILLPPDLQRSEFQERLKTEGIQSSVHYPPIHLFTYYRDHYGYQPGSLPITEDVAAREVSLPMHARLTQGQVNLVVNAVRKLLNE